MARTSEVQRDARIGEAAARMATTIKEAIAGEELMKSKLTNDTEIARLDHSWLGRAGAILLIFFYFSLDCAYCHCYHNSGFFVQVD